MQHRQLPRRGGLRDLVRTGYVFDHSNGLRSVRSGAGVVRIGGPRADCGRGGSG